MIGKFKIFWACKKFGIKNYTVNSDGSIDVIGDVSLSGKKLGKIPVKFRNVSGVFNCSSNNLISLENAPNFVGGSFYCNFNGLNTLEGGPSQVKHLFECIGNRGELKSLIGSPKFVGGGFYLSKSHLQSFEHGPEFVGGSFVVCENNVTSFIGSPKKVGSDFRVHKNKIKSFEGFPESISGIISLHGNNVSEIFNLNPCIEFVEMINEYGAIRNGEEVIEMRLKEALIDSGGARISGFGGKLIKRDPKTLDLRRHIKNYKIV